jgi:NAD(P)-dependent dehydrogenase (short-subunit alcohol dehydrogenase family)
MNGKVVVITGALGALGRVVAEEAVAQGARVAGVDHAPTQVPGTPDRLELGGVDLTDAAQAILPAASRTRRSLTATRKRGSACMR